MKRKSKRAKTRPSRNAGRKRQRKRVQTRGRSKQRLKRIVAKKPKIKRMKHAPRLYLEDRVGRLCFRMATRGADFKESTQVKMRCTATFRLDACTAMSSEDKTWEAVLVDLKQSLGGT